MSATVQELLRLVASPGALLQIATDLRITSESGQPASALVTTEDDRTERPWLVRDGFAGIGSAAPPELCASLVRGIQALRAHGLPATFIYAFDEPWALGEAIRRRISALVGRDYAVVEDAWAWQIEPGEGGWPPHRGIAHERLDREAPEVINVWVALSDASADRSCMHAIPLDEDPSYPGALDRVEAPLSAVRALPVSAGHALFWNANLLHWGGRCAARAAGPRVSCSFTLCRADAAARFPELSLLSASKGLGLVRRTDLVARMILVYGKGQPDVSDVVREWAGIAHGLASRFSRP